MTEQDAIAWLEQYFGGAAVARLQQFAAILVGEAGRQNLVARSTLDNMWSRHIVDSAQLIRLAPPSGTWVDIGSGGGLPGIVVAILRNQPTTLLEPRRKRADFLDAVCGVLGLEHATVKACRAEQFVGITATVVSARAVASADEIFDAAAAFSDLSTTFVLPKGRSASNDLGLARQSWQGTFHVKPSVTDADAGIIVATEVRRR